MNQHKHCPSCNASIPIHERRCPFCDAKQLTSAESRIFHFLGEMVPGKAPATAMLFFINIAIFVLVCIDIIHQPDTSLSSILWAPPTDVILRWGAHVRGHLEWWRLITANFLHIGLIHIAFNLSVLKAIGPEVERHFGSAMTFAAFVFLGFGSMLCSNVFGGTGLVAGASGALMAYVGMVAAAGHRSKTALGIEIRNKMLKWGAFVLGFGLLLSFSSSMGVDNIAHLSGLILGGLAGMILPTKGVTGFSKPWKIRLSAFCCIAAIAATILGGVGLVRQKQSIDAFHTCTTGLKSAVPAASVRTDCEIALEKNPSELGAYHNLALYYMRTQKPNMAIETCQKSLEYFTRQDIVAGSPLCTELLGLKGNASNPDSKK